MEHLEDLNEEEQAGLITGEDYILFNNLKHGITIWINCDPEIQVTLDSVEFATLIPSLFPNVNATELLREINKGAYVYTDKTCVKTIRSDYDLDKVSITPTLNDTIQAFNASKRSQKRTPFGFGF